MEGSGACLRYGPDPEQGSLEDLEVLNFAAQQGMKNGMTLINHPTGGFLKGIPGFIPRFPTFRTSKFFPNVHGDGFAVATASPWLRAWEPVARNAVEGSFSSSMGWFRNHPQKSWWSCELGILG